MSVYRRYSGKPFGHRAKSCPGIFLIFLLIISAAVAISLYLRNLSTELAVSMAQDAVTTAVGQIVRDSMAGAEENYSTLVFLEKDANGSISAISANMAALNQLAGDILLAVTAETADHDIEISIPFGTLTGSTLLLNRGPRIKVHIHVLSSTFAGFHSEMESMGINQSRHQILLQLREEITLIMPWRSVSTEAVTDIPIAETVIVGQVPQSYFNIGE